MVVAHGPYRESIRKEYALVMVFVWLFGRLEVMECSETEDGVVASQILVSP
jgi:hypothetical protein